LWFDQWRLARLSCDLLALQKTTLKPFTSVAQKPHLETRGIILGAQGKFGKSKNEKSKQKFYYALIYLFALTKMCHCGRAVKLKSNFVFLVV
jgi:hypothetical protein